MVEGHVVGDVGCGEEEDIKVIDDNGREEGVIGRDDDEEESSSSEEEEQQDQDAKKKRRKKESDIQKKVRKFWKERGIIKYGREWQMHSALYMEECVHQAKALKDKVYSLVHREHFERITASMYTLGLKKEEPISKYLHLKSSDNDLTKAIQHYLDCKDCSVIYVIPFTFSIVFIYQNSFHCGIFILYYVKHIMSCVCIYIFFYLFRVLTPMVHWLHMRVCFLLLTMYWIGTQ